MLQILGFIEQRSCPMREVREKSMPCSFISMYVINVGCQHMPLCIEAFE